MLDADEFERGAALIVFQAKLDDFAHSFHESVEIPCLRVAAAQSRNGSDEVVIFVPFDDYCELPRGSHEPDSSTVPTRLRCLLQLCVFRPGFLQDGNIRVGILPNRQEIPVSRQCPHPRRVRIRALRFLSLQSIRARHSQSC